MCCSLSNLVELSLKNGTRLCGAIATSGNSDMNILPYALGLGACSAPQIAPAPASPRALAAYPPPVQIQAPKAHASSNAGAIAGARLEPPTSLLHIGHVGCQAMPHRACEAKCKQQQSAAAKRMTAESRSKLSHA